MAGFLLIETRSFSAFSECQPGMITVTFVSFYTLLTSLLISKHTNTSLPIIKNYLWFAMT